MFVVFTPGQWYIDLLRVKLYFISFQMLAPDSPCQFITPRIDMSDVWGMEALMPLTVDDNTT